MSSRKLTKNTLSQSPVVVGFDCGYGHVKAIHGEDFVVFPSVAAHAHALKFKADEISAKYPGHLLQDGNEEWFTGELAVRQAPASEQIILQGRDNNVEENMQFRLRMLYSALSRLIPHQNGDVVQVQIATGLPVDHMADAPAMKAAFIGRHRIETNNADFVVDITTCIVMPQPYGTIYSQQFTDEGKLNVTHATTRCGVVDIGRFTIDCALDDDGEYIDSESGSRESGVFTAQKRIADVYELRYGAKPSHAEIEHMLRHNQVLISGQPVSMTAEVYEAFKPMRAATLSLMGNLWDKALDVHRIFITGGGAVFAAEEILARYPQAVLVDNPQLSNAIGYRNYALFLAQE